MSSLRRGAISYLSIRTRALRYLPCPCRLPQKLSLLCTNTYSVPPTSCNGRQRHLNAHRLCNIITQALLVADGHISDGGPRRSCHDIGFQVGNPIALCRVRLAEEASCLLESNSDQIDVSAKHGMPQPQTLSPKLISPFEHFAPFEWISRGIAL